MTEFPTLFKSLEDLRRVGARGGRSYGRNCRARRQAVQNAVPATVSPALPALETTAQAIVTLDVQFPCLRGAELHGDSRRQKN